MSNQQYIPIPHHLYGFFVFGGIGWGNPGQAARSDFPAGMISCLFLPGLLNFCHDPDTRKKQNRHNPLFFNGYSVLQLFIKQMFHE